MLKHCPACESFAIQPIIPISFDRIGKTKSARILERSAASVIFLSSSLTSEETSLAVSIFRKYARDG
jgi:hypothetical protein